MVTPDRSNFDGFGYKGRTWKGIELLGSKIIYYFVRSRSGDRRGTTTPIKFIHLLYQRLVNSRQTTVTRSSTRGYSPRPERNPFLPPLPHYFPLVVTLTACTPSLLLQSPPLFVNNLRDACAPLHHSADADGRSIFFASIFFCRAKSNNLFPLSLSALPFFFHSCFPRIR